MLIVEHCSNGQRIVKLKKDWHPALLSRAYIPKQRNNIVSDSMYKLQTALLRKDKK